MKSTHYQKRIALLSLLLSFFCLGNLQAQDNLEAKYYLNIQTYDDVIELGFQILSESEEVVETIIEAYEANTLYTHELTLNEGHYTLQPMNPSGVDSPYFSLTNSMGDTFFKTKNPVFLDKV